MTRKEPPGQLRIIGGHWRGRRLKIVKRPQLRPTPDRLRETLFNWLMTRVQGRVCVDLFAGTGALGLEALSRGAARSVFVEQDAATVRHLRAQIKTLAAAATVAHADASAWLSRAQAREEAPFHLVFLDPPYDKPELAQRCWEILQQQNLLAADALVYLEYDSGAQPSIPPRWQLAHKAQAGRSCAALYRADMVE